MFPAPFEYHAPTTLQEALQLLAQHGDNAKVLAGGQSLVPMMKMRLAMPAVVIDLNRIAELCYIREEGEVIAIGAMTRHYEVETSELLKRRCPLLSECAAHIGDVQVRNRGTIGGSLAHADPAADYPAAILACDAEIKVVNTNGAERVIKATDFFVDLFATALQPNELITEVRVPAFAPKTGSAYLKMEQLASGFALCGVAVKVTLDGGVIQDVRVGKQLRQHLCPNLWELVFEFPHQPLRSDSRRHRPVHQRTIHLTSPAFEEWSPILPPVGRLLAPAQA
jgi:carbon-monoxide dehydrogenase medium subunit